MEGVKALLLTSLGEAPYCLVASLGQVVQDSLPNNKVLTMQARYTATLVWVVSFLFSQTREDSLAMLVAALPILFPITTSGQLLLEVVEPR